MSAYPGFMERVGRCGLNVGRGPVGRVRGGVAAPHAQVGFWPMPLNLKLQVSGALHEVHYRTKANTTTHGSTEYKREQFKPLRSLV